MTLKTARDVVRLKGKMNTRVVPRLRISPKRRIVPAGTGITMKTITE